MPDSIETTFKLGEIHLEAFKLTGNKHELYLALTALWAVYNELQ